MKRMLYNFHKNSCVLSRKRNSKTLPHSFTERKEAVLLGYLKNFPMHYTVSLNEIILTDGESHQLAVLRSANRNLTDGGLRHYTR